MPRHHDERIYRTFEEFEREELRRLDAVGTSVDDMLDELFAEELDFDAPYGTGGGRRSRAADDADDEE